MSKTERLIPACAGRAPGWVRAWTFFRAHPRMRGEGFDNRGQDMPFTGSSPHARGGLRGFWGVRQLPRLIPACAGRANPVGA